MASLADPSVRAPEPQQTAMVIIGSFGLASLAFCVAAELSRVRVSQGEPTPQLPISPNSPIAAPLREYDVPATPRPMPLSLDPHIPAPL